MGLSTVPSGHAAWARAQGSYGVPTWSVLTGKLPAASTLPVVLSAVGIMSQVIAHGSTALYCPALCCAVPSGPEPGLTRDPTYGWIKHAGLDVQLVDTAGWKRATAMQPTQSPTASPDSSTKGRPSGAAAGRTAVAAAAKAVEGEQAQEAAAAAADADRRLLGKQLADASLVQARRALNACHVAVLLLDAPRLLTIQQVSRPAAGVWFLWARSCVVSMGLWCGYLGVRRPPVLASPLH